MPTKKYDQYYLILSDSDLELLSSSVDQSDSGFYNDIPYIADIAEIGLEQTCILYYSRAIDRFVWVRAVTSQDSRDGQKECLLHVLHDALDEPRSDNKKEQMSDSLRNAVSLSLLTGLSRHSHDAATGKLAFDAELPGMRITADYDTFSAIVDVILSGFYKGKGITVVCPAAEYDDCFAQVALFLLQFLPDDLKKQVSVRMSPFGESSHSLINIIRDDDSRSGSDSLKLEYCGGMLRYVEPPALSPVSRAVYDYLTGLIAPDLSAYYKKLLYILRLHRKAKRDSVPPDVLYYILCISFPEKIRLSMPVTDAISRFLSLSQSGKWEHIKIDVFFLTLTRMCVMLLDGMQNCSDSEPSSAGDDFGGLVGILHEGPFPDCFPFERYASFLIRFLLEKKRNRQAAGAFLALQRLFPDNASDVTDYFRKKGSDVRLILGLVPTLRGIAEPESSVSFMKDEYEDEVLNLLCNAVVSPQNTGGIEKTESLLRRAVNNIGNSKPEWLSVASDSLKSQIHTIFQTIPHPGVFDEILAYRCRVLHQFFGIDAGEIVKVVLDLYDKTKDRQRMNAAVTGAFSAIGIDPLVFEPSLDIPEDELVAYVTEKIKAFSSLSQMLARAHELISIRRYLNHNTNVLSVYFRCILVAFDLEEEDSGSLLSAYFVRRNFRELDSLIEGTFRYYPLYKDSVPFHQSSMALLALYGCLICHLEQIHRTSGIDRFFLEENALTTVLVIKTDFAAADRQRNNFNPADFRTNPDYSFFRIMTDKRIKITPSLCAEILTENIIRPVSEIIQYVPFHEGNVQDYKKFRIMLLMAMRILFGESTGNIKLIMKDAGYSFSMYTLTLAALMADQSPVPVIRQELAGNVNNAFGLYHEVFASVSDETLVKRLISKIISELDSKDYLPCPAGAVIHTDFDCRLKAPINDELLALWNRKSAYAERSLQIARLRYALEQYRLMLATQLSQGYPY